MEIERKSYFTRKYQEIVQSEYCITVNDNNRKPNFFNLSSSTKFQRNETFFRHSTYPILSLRIPSYTIPVRREEMCLESNGLGTRDHPLNVATENLLMRIKRAKPKAERRDARRRNNAAGTRPRENYRFDRTARKISIR